MVMACRMPWWLLIMVGALVGTLLVTSPGSLAVLTLVALLLRGIRRFATDDHRYLSWLCGVGFAARAVAAFLLLFIFAVNHPLAQSDVMTLPPSQRSINYFCYRIPDLFGDSDSGFYSLQGLWLSQAVARPHIDDAYRRFLARVFGDPLGRSYHVYLLGAYHYLFGFSPYSVLLVNALIGTLGGLFVYLFTRRLFGVPTASLAGVLGMFWPSLFLWSLSNLKEPGVILSLLVFFWALMGWFQRRAWRWFVTSLIAACVQVILRKELLCLVIPMLAFSVSYPFLVARSTRWKRWAVGIGVVLITILQLFSNGQFLRRPLDRFMDTLVMLHQGHQQGWAYQYLDGDSYPLMAIPSHWLTDGKRLSVLGNAWIHFLFEPFPNRLDTLWHALCYPQVLLWYACVLFGVLGLVGSWGALPRGGGYLCLAYLAGFGSLVALASGNIGTVLRHRDMFTPLYLSFTAAWFVWLDRRSVRPHHLVSTEG